MLRAVVAWLCALFAGVSLAGEAPLRLARLEAPPTIVAAPDSARIEAVLERLTKRLRRQPADPEARLVHSVLRFRNGDRQGALAELDRLVRDEPDFNLAWLVRGDLRLAALEPVSDVGRSPLSRRFLTPEQRARLERLREEARLRLAGIGFDGWRDRLPDAILALGESVDNALLVDKRLHRLFVYGRDADGRLRMQADYYVSTGKLEGDKRQRGDLRTPEGVYFITSHIPREKLPDKYGIGAFPVNYPNELDRRLGKTGYGIWLHGTESRYYSRPPRDSEGCMVLTNRDLERLQTELAPGRTPVVISPGVEWLAPAEWQRRRREVLAAIEAWRRDWESLDLQRYLAHYADDFWAPGFDLAGWQRRKRQVFAGKTFQKIAIEDLTLLAYPRRQPDAPAVVVARFTQDYRSNNYDSRMRKRLYLKQVAGKWKVWYEGR